MSKWSAEEASLLESLKDRATLRHIAKKTGRSRSAVAAKLYRQRHPQAPVPRKKRGESALYRYGVSAWIDAEMFAAVQALAAKHQSSMSEALRLLVQWGLDSMGEEE